MNDSMFLGASLALESKNQQRLVLPPHHLTTHGVLVGMTGSGKTGLLTVIIEEAARAGVPVLCVDVKGDMANLLLAFPDFAPQTLVPWVELSPTMKGDNPREALAARLAEDRRKGLGAWGIDLQTLLDYRQRTHVRVLTPGADAGELLHVLSSLERRSARWDDDVEGARAALSAAISLVLRLLGRDADPARSREHVSSTLAEQRLIHNQPADLASLLPEVIDAALRSIGALPVESFVGKRARKDLAAALNALPRLPSFASWSKAPRSTSARG